MKGHTMSAYMVSIEQINVMVWAATRYGELNSFMFESSYGIRTIQTFQDKTAMGQELLDTNAQALKDLYNDDTGFATYAYQPPRHATWQPIDLIKIVHNYEYQACDNKNWANSDAQRFCAALVRQLLHYVPGFEAAPWGIEEDSVPAYS